MIDLTPLDVRNKRGDFKRILRGYDPQEVDVFLEVAAERLEALVRENLQLKERTQTLQEQVASQQGREQAVQDALVTAQELRNDIKLQAQREAEHVLKEAQAEARRLVSDAEGEARGRVRELERRLDSAEAAFAELERRRSRFLTEFRQLLERELDVVEVEAARSPSEERPIDLDLGRGAREAGQAVEIDALAPDAPSGPDEAMDPEGPGEEVPRLEEVLAEAGAEVVEPQAGAGPDAAQEISPPPAAEGEGDAGSEGDAGAEGGAEAEGGAGAEGGAEAEVGAEDDPDREGSRT